MAKTHLTQSAWCRASRCLVVWMSSKLVQALCAPGAAKDLAIGSIAQALVACVPSSAFSSEVNLLLSSLNGRPASIIVVVPQDGLRCSYRPRQFRPNDFSFGQHLLQTDVLGQELIEIVDQRGRDLSVSPALQSPGCSPLWGLITIL